MATIHRMRGAVAVVGVALFALGCSGVGGDPLGDGGVPDSADDHKIGVTLDAGADADSSGDACSYPDADPNFGHVECYPVVDSLCSETTACGTFKYHYACGGTNAPPTNMNCLDVGNDDYCCGTSACVPDMGNPMTNCTNESHGYTSEIACPPGDAPPTGSNPSPSDSGVTWYCVPPQ